MKFAAVSALLVPFAAAAATPVQEAAAAAAPEPVQDGITKDCKRYYEAKAGDSCYGIVQDNGVFTFDQFLKWNPAVGKNCDGLLVGYNYCIGVSGTPSKCTENHPTPTQAGSVCKCGHWYKVRSGDSCYAIEQKFGISKAEFQKLNSGVNNQCSNLQAGVNICVKA